MSSLAASSNTNVDNFVDKFLTSLPELHAGNDVNFLGEGCSADEINTTPPPSRVLFTVALPSGPAGNNDSPERADAPRGSIFPSTIPTLNNRFFNQNSELNDDGYDSKGGLPFFTDNDVDDADNYFEAPKFKEDAVDGPPPPAAAPATEQLTIEAMNTLKMKELKEELRKRGRSIVGKKGELQARLREAILLNVPVASGDEACRHESMAGSDVTARWVLLNPEDEPFPQPENPDQSHRPPTKMDGILNLKYAMKENFVHGVFTRTNEKMRYTALYNLPTARPPKKRVRRTRKLSPSRMHVDETVEPRVLGGPNTDFLARYGLDETSHPMDWFSAFMPMTPIMNKEDPAVANVKGDRTTNFAVSNWTGYSNAKAMLCNAGEPGSIYAGKFKPFKNEDITAMLGVYIIDGLAPSPQLTQKMQDQERQPTHGNDWIAAVIGPGWQQKHRSFRHFFATQDPMMMPPPKTQCPNFKVDELFRWLRHIWKEAWVLGMSFLNDEQSCKMQGKSEYKTRCGKFKRLGDGIQADCIADAGYTWDFYFCNEPSSPEFLAQGFCPMHCRLLHMFSNLREHYHCCTMDNLFNSVKLARGAYSLPKPVLVQGVLRKSGRGCPPSVLQEDKTGKQAEAARGTVKAAVLKGDSMSSDLIVALCYDQKPFYMISSKAEEVSWAPITKKVWSSSLKAMVDFTFLRWSLLHYYNFEMNDNDIADQLRLVYRIMRFQRNNKWWWALFLWGYEVSMVNAYMCMKRYCELKGVAVPWTHHDWNEAIGYAHLDPAEYWQRRKEPFDSSAGTAMANKAPISRGPRVDSSALLPTRGKLKCRLDHDTRIHMPLPPLSANATCQLHRWAHKETHPLDKMEGANAKPSGSRSHVMRCDACGVHLCLNCWAILHQQKSLKQHVFDILKVKDT
jgi:hypothetical protein